MAAADNLAHQSSQLTNPPVCELCGKAMRFVSASPLAPYVNLKQAKFECDCGATRVALLADND